MQNLLENCDYLSIFLKNNAVILSLRNCNKYLYNLSNECIDFKKIIADYADYNDNLQRYYKLYDFEQSSPEMVKNKIIAAAKTSVHILKYLMLKYVENHPNLNPYIYVSCQYGQLACAKFLNEQDHDKFVDSAFYFKTIKLAKQNKHDHITTWLQNMRKL